MAVVEWAKLACVFERYVGGLLTGDEFVEGLDSFLDPFRAGIEVSARDRQYLRMVQKFLVNLQAKEGLFDLDTFAMVTEFQALVSELASTYGPTTDL